VYGCLIACLFLWLTIIASSSSSWLWTFGAGIAAAVALLLKLEFGLACYAALITLIAARGLKQQSWKRIPKDLMLILPGVVLCAAVIHWMVSIAGAEFITQENFMSWPTSFFMKTYGKMWLDQTGFSITGVALAGALVRTTLLIAVLLGFYLILRKAHSEKSSTFLVAQLCVAGLAFLVAFLPRQAERYFLWIFFPQDMVLYVAIASPATWWYLWRQPASERRPQAALLFTFSSLLAFRILLGMHPTAYAIYYNGPVVLAYLLLLARLLNPNRGCRPLALQAEVLVCFACLIAVVLHASPLISHRMKFVPLTTERGMIRVPKEMAENYRVALAFMKEKAAKGESVLSVPEDTSLYFLSGTHCPTRVFAFTPGMVVPGNMTKELIQEIEKGPTKYLIWSNREFPEYGGLRFGTDYDRTLGDYLKSHYHPLRSLLPKSEPGWKAVIWERIPEGESR
jgi:hypothetical protein